MLRERIKRKAHEVVYSTGTSDPIKICEAKHIPVYYDDLGKQIMAYHTVIKRIPAIVLSTRNSEFENTYSWSRNYLGNYDYRLCLGLGLLIGSSSMNRSLLWSE